MKNQYIFCEETSHKRTDCKKVTNINARKRIVASKKFSSTAYLRVTELLRVKTREHVATAMTSNTPPYAANQLNSNHLLLKNHEKQPVMTIKERDVIYPVVVILVDEIKCSSGHRSYISYI